MDVCKVCGSSAPIIRGDLRRQTVITLCYYHEYVCADHLADPCSVCDAR